MMFSFVFGLSEKTNGVKVFADNALGCALFIRISVRERIIKEYKINGNSL